MTIDTFKKLCLKSNTKKADEIHKYYIKLEKIFHEIIDDESNELREQLEMTNKNNIKEKHDILLESYDNRYIVYLIKINNYDNLYKFGASCNIKSRFKQHKNTIKNINLIFCIESKNNLLLETNLKQWLKTTKYQTEKTFNNLKYTELIEIDDINIIINKIKELNNNLFDNEYIQELQQKIEVLKNENTILKNENYKLKENTNIQEISINKSSTNDDLKPIFENFIINNIKYNHRSRLNYAGIIKLFTNYITNETNNVNIVFNNELHENLFNYIRTHFNLKNNNKTCIKDVTFIKNKIYYNDDIYKNFIKENIIIKDKSKSKSKDKDNKIINSYLYQVSVDTIYNKFIEYVKKNNIEYISKTNEYYSTFLKTEIKNKICEFAKSKLFVSNSRNEHLLSYIGIILKTVDS
jgi:hypothetical protein